MVTAGRGDAELEQVAGGHRDAGDAGGVGHDDSRISGVRARPRGRAASERDQQDECGRERGDPSDGVHRRNIARMATVIAVVGGGEPGEEEAALAEAVGSGLAQRGAVVVCGGLGGVMEAACRGARSAGGMTVGILPGRDPADANPCVDVAVATGMGEARNAVIVNTAHCVVAVGGEYGTLSEIALALRAGKPVVGLRTWDLTRPDGTGDTGVVAADGPEAAVELALQLAGRARV